MTRGRVRLPRYQQLVDHDKSLSCSHSHSLTDRGHVMRGEHHVPFGEDGSLAHKIPFADSHFLDEDAVGHHETLIGEYCLLLLNDPDGRMEV